MKIDLSLKMPDRWIVESDIYTDESGVEVTHLEASDNKSGSFIEIHAGPMPDGETAEDQAFVNYAESVGFDDDDEESPIVKFKFNGKNAWGFEAECDDNKPLRLIAQEVKKGLLAIIIIGASDDAELENISSMVEKNLRIKAL